MKLLLVLAIFCLNLSLTQAQDFLAGNFTETTTVDNPDTLTLKRRFFSTDLYQSGQRLTPAKVHELYQSHESLNKLYKAGRALQPVGPLLSASGIVLGYLAIKGKDKVAQIDYNNESITAPYTVRSLPKLVAGLALFAGGLCLVEFSSELITRSAQRYNKQIISTGKAWHNPSFRLGIRPGGQLAILADF